jgi:pilus assembly protein FimV
LLSPAANAAGLGKLTVLSSLGQPLKAEIELTAVSADDAGALVAKLAPVDAFRAANIDFNPTLLSLRFEIDQRNGRQIIRISSGQPVNEPFVDMLLELNWTGGRMVREYTFLLDPAEMRATQSAQVAAPVDLGRPQATQAAAPAAAATAPAPATPAARPSRPAAPPAAAEPAAKQAAGEYKVKPGDNLSRIAGQLKPVDVSLDMMLVALYRANPEAFSGNNMNRLKSGQILAVPDSDAIRAGNSEGEARGVVVAHAADFNAYRAKLAGQVATSAPAKEAPTSQSAAGKITAKVEERPTAANESKDQLKLSKATPADATSGKTGAAVEDKIAKEKQVAEAAARVKELEKNVSDLEKLMAVKSKAMADQKKVAASAAASAPAVSKTPVIDLNEPQKPAEAAKPAKPKRTIVVPKSVVEPTLMDTLMDNITYVGAALAAILLGGLGLVAARRRKQEQEVEQRVESSLLGDTGIGTQSQQLIAEAGGQSVDTNNSVFNSNFAPSASQLDTNEVDPVAEADVYIAYGRDAQAEEILKEALRTHPERHAVRLKLLEIYANRKDARAFETQASELYSQTRGEGEEWAQAAAMGMALDASNPLYGMGRDDNRAAPAAAIEPLDASMFAAPAAAAAAVGAAEFVDHFNTQAPNTAARDSGLDLDLSLDAPPAGNGMEFTTDAQTALPDLNEFTAAPAVPTPAEMAASNDADQFLDFDLGGLSFDAPAAPAAEIAPAPKEEESMFDLAFDTTPAAPAVETVAPAPAPAVEDFGMDFGLDLPPEVAAAPAPAPAAADPLADLDLMDFDIPAVAALPVDAMPAPADIPPLTADDFADSLELQGQPAPLKAEAPSAPEFDLSGIDLDLDHGNTATATEARPAEVKEEAMSAHHMEMDTKLDLAIAYQEIGDKEGARELLDEVIRGGSDEQVSKANAMRAQLG